MRVLRVLSACVLGLFLQACTTSQSSSSVSPTPTADFSLAASSSTVSVNAGASAQITLTATASNGFTGAIAVTVAGLPQGVTASPSTLSVSAGTPLTITLNAAASAAAGTAQLTFTGTSGSLSHTASTSLTVVPVQDFALTATPTQVTATAGGTGAQITVRADAVNGFNSNVSVAITGLPTGVTATPASLTLIPGTAQTVTLNAAASAAASTSTITFTATAGALSHAAMVALTVQAAVPAATAPDVITYHYNTMRNGVNTQETILTPTNVTSTTFGKVGFFTADGKVDAQPLFLANLTVSGQSHNVLYMASEHGTLYALDADTGSQLWKTSVIPSGESTSDDHGCSQITSEIGITSTPVIDRSYGAHGAIFLVSMSKESNGTYHQRLHALDITTGAELSGSPTEITATYPGTGSNSTGGNVVFDPAQYAERAALLLANGKIYLAWTSHCDFSPYTGWVMSYSESTLKQVSVMNLTPNGSMGAIWMSGNGLATDSTGDIYLLTGNGTFDNTLTNGFPANGNFGNTMLRLHETSGKLSVADYFAAYNTTDLSNRDLDLGSGGEMLFDVKDTAGTTHHLMTAAGKDSVLYIADRDNMGHFNPATVSPDTNLYQKISGQIGGAFDTPVYFNGVVYWGSDGNALKAFPVTNAKLATTPSSKSAVTYSHPGTTPTVSANGTQNGIVWALQSSTSAAAVLHAYDPTNLANEYYNSTQAANSRDAFGNGNKFITPMIVNGKVYIGTPTGVAVFGLLPK